MKRSHRVSVRWEMGGHVSTHISETIRDFRYLSLVYTYRMFGMNVGKFIVEAVDHG